MHTVDTIMPEMIKLRVHIAPVGFEIDRVVIPATKMKADKVYLLRHDNYSEDKSGPYREKIIKKLNKNLLEDYSKAKSESEILEICHEYGLAAI